MDTQLLIGEKTLNKIFNYIENNDEIIIIGLKEDVTTTSIVIPETIDNTPVTTIVYEAFKGSPITNIQIGKNIRAIDIGAFEDCQSLTSVIWNDHCKTIPDRCFFGCVSLSTFDFSSVKIIGKWAFEESGLQEVNLPRNIQEVKDFAFSNCKSLKAFHWNAQTKNIPLCCFINCTSLSIFDFLSVESIHTDAFAESGLQEVNLPQNIQEVGEFAFRECKSLKAFHWNAQTKSIPQYCFYNCLSLSTFDFSSVESIHEGAFAGSGLQEANLPRNIQKVELFAFQDCKSLVKVEWLSDEPIEIYTFANCERLKEVNISDQVKNIEVNAFQGCPNAEFSFI